MAKKKGGIGKVILIAFVVFLMVGIILLVGLVFLVMQDVKENMAGIGDTVPDFSVNTTDGKTISLEELLQENDCVVLNVFTTWCGPCKVEFPEMEAAYEKDHAGYEIVAVADDKVTVEDVAAYQKEMGLTFPMGILAEKADALSTFAYPTTYVIDRNKKVGFRQEGYFRKAEDFEKVVDSFRGENYEEKQVALYTMYAWDKDGTPIPGVEVRISSAAGTETMTTGEDGTISCFMENPKDVTVTVISAPEGYSIKGEAEASLDAKSTWVKLDVVKK